MKKFFNVLLLSILVSIDHCQASFILMYNLYKTSRCMDKDFLVLVRQISSDGLQFIENAYSPLAIGAAGPLMYMVNNVHLSSELITEFEWIYAEQSSGGCCWSVKNSEVLSDQSNQKFAIDVYPSTSSDVYNCFHDQSVKALCSNAYTTESFSFRSCQYTMTNGDFRYSSCQEDMDYTLQDCSSANSTGNNTHFNITMSSTEHILPHQTTATVIDATSSKSILENMITTSDLLDSRTNVLASSVTETEQTMEIIVPTSTNSFISSDQTSTSRNSFTSTVSTPIASQLPERKEDLMNQLQNINTLNASDVAVAELRTIIENVTSINNAETVKSVIQVAGNLVDTIKNDLSQMKIYESISSLLIALDILGGIVGQTEVGFCNGNCTENSSIILQVSEVTIPTTAIEYPNNNSISISFPSNFVFNESNVVSYYYHNLTALLKPSDAKKSLVSPIISAYVDCGNCTIDIDQVFIQFNLKNLDILEYINGGSELSCVSIQMTDNTPFNGVWDKAGCSLNASGGGVFICNCTHLTHFAILLSPRLDIPETHVKILNAIGLTLVPISLVCMLAVILIYSLIRSLWNMRVYVHIMLCGSLFISQLVFIIGVDKTQNKNVCSGIAVLLEYLFLVSFMWMLMEGVVLYVSLTRVFMKNTKYYLIVFTMVCFGIPAIYMAIIVPIGFLVQTSDLNENTHFLYQTNNLISACWLNYESYFIWSFISPVIAIIIINIGFFIMTVIILRKHEKKIHGKHAVRRWIKVSVSLTSVMGITWLGGVLAFTKELVAIAYIMTTLIASQGLVMFIILVPLSKQVREVFIKKLKNRFPDSYIINSTKLFSIESKYSTGSNGKNTA